MTHDAIRRYERAAIAALLAVAAASLGAVSPTDATSARGSQVRGGSGVITTHGLGARHFEVATSSSIRAFAGKPNSTRYENKLGQSTGPRKAVWAIWEYKYSGGGYVYYSFHRTKGTWRFVKIDTNRKQFRTARGTRVGMTYAQAKKREGGSYMGGCIDKGFWHFRDGRRYAVVVGVNKGQRVHALHGYGPGQPIC